MELMKVLQINAVNAIGSTGRNTKEIADYLNSHGHEGYIAYSVGPSYPRGYQIGTTLDKKIHALLSRFFGLQGYFSKRSTKKLLFFIRSIKPDIVHLGNLHSNFINLSLLLSFLADNDIPTVLTLHDCWFYTGKCTHYTVDCCFKWKDTCGNCPRVKKDNTSWFFDRTEKMLSDKKKLYRDIPRLAVIGVSDWITQEAKSSILQSANIIERIYNWIDLDIFKPSETSSLKTRLLVEKKFIILGVASGWGPSKGLDKFFALANHLPDEMIIILVGKMNNSVAQSNIIHIPETDNISELVAYYSIADVFLNLSLEESFGKVSAEALACGTPVISINSTANAELVREGCGFVVDEFNIDQLINLFEIIKLKTKQAFSEKCINFANENFNKDDRCSDHIDLYTRLLANETNLKI